GGRSSGWIACIGGRTRHGRRERDLGHGLPAGLQLDRGARLRRGQRTCTRERRRLRVRPLLRRPGLPVFVHVGECRRSEEGRTAHREAHRVPRLSPAAMAVRIDPMATARKYDLYSNRFRAEAYATFARMREEDPVFCQLGIDGETMLWFVTRHDDAVAVLLDDERFVRDPSLALTAEELAAFQSGMPEGMRFVENHMLNKDGEDHRRLRRLVTKAFTPRMVEQLRPRIEEIADELIDAVESRGEMDLVDEFAFPLPITVIAELLGIPVADRDRFRRWTNAMVTPVLTPEDIEQFGAFVAEFVAYLR